MLHAIATITSIHSRGSQPTCKSIFHPYYPANGSLLLQYKLGSQTFASKRSIRLRSVQKYILRSWNCTLEYYLSNITLEYYFLINSTTVRKKQKLKHSSLHFSLKSLVHNMCPCRCPAIKINSKETLPGQQGSHLDSQRPWPIHRR